MLASIAEGKRVLKGAERLETAVCEGVPGPTSGREHQQETLRRQHGHEIGPLLEEKHQ